ncbi:MAG: hypothetical protein OEW09_18585, partial [Anaerolineae bacterium]|nr:hypothetical protein [Anaerolineae bacterium]
MKEHSALVIKNGSVLLPSGELCSCDILIQNGLIQKVGPSLESELQVDAAGGYIVPGLIELHTHGIHTESAETGDLAEYARIEASFGTTTFYPTFFGPPEESAQQMQRHRRETDELRLLPQIGGFRLESPYLAQTGAGVSKDLVSISSETTGIL